MKLLKKQFLETQLVWRAIYEIDGMRVTVFGKTEEELPRKAAEQSGFAASVKARLKDPLRLLRLYRTIVQLHGENSQEVKNFLSNNPDFQAC